MIWVLAAYFGVGLGAVSFFLYYRLQDEAEVVSEGEGWSAEGTPDLSASLRDRFARFGGPKIEIF